MNFFLIKILLNYLETKNGLKSIEKDLLLLLFLDEENLKLIIKEKYIKILKFKFYIIIKI